MNPAEEYKDLVRRGYDDCADAYGEARKLEAEPSLEMMISLLDEEAVVLDAGCDAGVPVTRR